MAVLSRQLWIGLLGLTNLGHKYSKTKLCVFPRHSCDLDPWLPTRLTQLDWEVLQSTKESEADKKRQTWTRVPCVLIKTPKFVLIVAASVADPPREQTSNLSSNGLRVITLLLPKLVDERWKEERERGCSSWPLKQKLESRMCGFAVVYFHCIHYRLQRHYFPTFWGMFQHSKA